MCGYLRKNGENLFRSVDELPPGEPVHHPTEAPGPILFVAISGEGLRIHVVFLAVQFDQRLLGFVGEVGPAHEPSLPVSHCVLRTRHRKVARSDDAHKQILEPALRQPIPIRSHIEHRSYHTNSASPPPGNTIDEMPHFVEREQPLSQPNIQARFDQSRASNGAEIDHGSCRCRHRHAVDNDDVMLDQIQ